MFLSNPGKCDGSGNCVDACPTDAIKLVDGKVVSCITCGKCEGVCPNKAIYENKFGGYVVDRTKCNLCGMCMNVQTMQECQDHPKQFSQKIKWLAELT